ncbi:hypothetical protein BO83DRAFT_439880 [Aspergillus eucalypticola CBS 122712]|uniref:Uncharacterized protein n=1 Tax=Aspergillus eucalypticola (strain CBS 122712 / IBT 29274) TaxID=1448314 RepID=A0A317UYG7_ASPEC|nr:uncharacterized protein BO83DRAFT_439880 [Aspergillus eucalypticola CBS 122712]PWY66636.1 hypothetical protein BO83DRAFT_439880 [Aspergillus eucalypticola CBS 122712]
MRFSVISVSLLSLFASSALAIPSASGTLSCSDVSSELSGYEQRLAKATDTSSPKYQAVQNLIDSAKNLESADCGSSSKRSYYPPESTGLIGEILNAVDSLVTPGSRSVNDQPITEKRDFRRRAWDRPDQVPSQSRRTMEGCNVQDDLGLCSLYRRIVLVENISRGIVEILGSTLDIDPLFLEAHIGRNGCSSNPMLEYADYSCQKFLTCHYPRAITLEGVQGSVESLAEWKNSYIAMVLLLQHYDSELIRRAVRKKVADIKKDPEDCTRPPKQSESSVSNLTGFRRWFMSTINPPQAQVKITQLRESSEKKTRRINWSDPVFQTFMTMRTWIMPIITQNYRDIKYLRSQTLALPPIIDTYDAVINSLGQFASALDTRW